MNCKLEWSLLQWSLSWPQYKLVQNSCVCFGILDTFDFFHFVSRQMLWPVAIARQDINNSSRVTRYIRWILGLQENVCTCCETVGRCVAIGGRSAFMCVHHTWIAKGHCIDLLMNNFNSYFRLLINFIVKGKRVHFSTDMAWTCQIFPLPRDLHLHTQLMQYYLGILPLCRLHSCRKYKIPFHKSSLPTTILHNVPLD